MVKIISGMTRIDYFREKDGQMERNSHTLLEVLSGVRESLENSFPESLWVRAEISSLKLHSSGHCYVELSQSGTSGVIAKIRGTVWRSKWMTLEPYFRSVTGATLGVGMAVLVRAKVRYSELYGLSLDIDAIDPNYTLGEKEAKRQATIERLTKEGLVEAQKRLAISPLPYRLAVVTASGAAGYRDFRNHLGDNGYGFVFEPVLIEATMQGENAPASIVSALAEVDASWTRFDAVLILRGGGSELDLACFDDYDIAVAIARCRVPVITAIGHDQDFHVADMVAFEYVKTPTALADYFIDIYLREDKRLDAFLLRIKTAFANKVSAIESRIDAFGARIGMGAEARLKDASHHLESVGKDISNSAKGRLDAASHRLERLSDVVLFNAGRRLDTAGSSLGSLAYRIRSAAMGRVMEASSALLNIETRISVTDPRNILGKGYALALDGNGVKMSSASDAKVGDRVRMMFADGTVKCGVFEVEMKNNVPSGETLGGEERKIV